MASNVPFGDMNKEERDFRPDFTEFLNKKCEPCNNATVFVVRQMNSAMVSEGNKMTENHYKVATNSLENGDHLCDFMRKENSDVLKGSGQGFFYTAGRYAHEAIRWGGFAKDEKPPK